MRGNPQEEIEGKFGQGKLSEVAKYFYDCIDDVKLLEIIRGSILDGRAPGAGFVSGGPVNVGINVYNYRVVPQML